MGSKHGHPGADGGGLKGENVHSLSNKVKKGYCLSRFRLLYQKCHRLGGLNHKHLFLTVLKSKKSKIGAREDLVSGKSPLPGS